MSNGKGSAPRPLAVESDEYERRWRATFGAALNAGRDRLSAELHVAMHGTLPLAEVGNVQQIVNHEPDPSGGRKAGE